MILKYTIHVVTGSDGRKDAAVVNEPSGTVHILSIDSQQRTVHFEGRAYLLAKWCEDYGLDHCTIEKEQTV